MRWTEKLILILLLLGTLGIAWNAALELDPADSNPVSEGAQNIRETRIETRGRLHTEHCFGSGFTDSNVGCAGTGSVDNGRHREGSALAFFEDTAPTTLGDGPGGTSVEDFDPTGGGGSSTLEQGRMWFDSNDSNRLTVWDTAGPSFEPVLVQTASVLEDMTDVDDMILAGRHNLVYNGSFEITDGDGDLAAAVVPAGWAEVGTPSTIAYLASGDTATYNGGAHVSITSDAGVEGISYTLTNVATGIYEVIARVDVDAGDTCRLNTTGATTTDLADQDSTSTSWATVSGQFTAATGDDIVVQLLNVLSTDVCRWDHVAVYFVGDITTDRDEISLPGLAVYYDGSDGVTALTGTPLVLATVVVEPPGPGYIVEITAATSVICNVNFSSVLADVHNGTASVVEAFFEAGDDGSQPSSDTMVMYYIDRAPVANVAITYELRADEISGTCTLVSATQANIDAHYMYAKLIPTR